MRECGADSIEHGRYVDKEAIEAMAGGTYDLGADGSDGEGT